MSAHQDLMTALVARRPDQSAAEDERIVEAVLAKHAHELAAQYAAMLRAYPDYQGVMDLAAALVLGEDHPHRRHDHPVSSDEPQPVDDGLCHATLQGWPHTTVIRCSREAGHYDEAQEPDFTSSDEPEPGGWHQSEPGEDGNRTTWADRADGATPHAGPVRPGEETTP